MTKRRIGAGLTVLAGLVLGIFTLLASLQHGGRASAATIATCSGTATTASVAVGDGTTALSNVGGLLVVKSGSSTVACSGPPGALAALTSITLSVASGAVAPITVVIDETGTGGPIPCNVAINGSMAITGSTSDVLEVKGAAGTNITAGVDSGRNNEIDPNACGVARSKITVTGMNSYDLVGGTNTGTTSSNVTLSAAGPTSDGFSGPATIATTLDGSLSGSGKLPDTFAAGDRVETFVTATMGSVLDFSAVNFSAAIPACTANCVLTLNSSTATVPVPGSAPTTDLSQYTAAVTNGGSTPLATYDYTSGGSDFTTIKGLSSGSTNVYLPGAATQGAAPTYNLSGNNVIANGSADSTFYNVSLAGPGSAPAGLGNQVAAGPGTETFAVTGTGLSVVGGPGTDTFTVTPPSTLAKGNNTFVAGSGTDFFYAAGTGNTANIVDFSKVQTSSSSVGRLAINVAGGPQGVGPSGNTTLNNGQAAVGSSVDYTFSAGPSSTDTSPFTSFIGATSGNTTFLAGATPGYTFAGKGANNSIDFSAVTSGVNVDLSAFPAAGTANFGGTCPAACDTITGLTTVVGSNGGGNHFTAGPAGATYTFTGNGDNNTFVGGGGPDIFNSNGSDNIFTAGTGNATYNDSGASNTVDLSALVGSSVVDVAGQTVGSTANDTATSGGATYTFTSFGTTPATFKGSIGGTTFYAGTVGDTFRGNSASDTLSFADTQSSGPLTFTPVQACPAPGVVPTGQATLGPVSEPFCGIEIFDGLAGGNTTLVTDGTPGLTFAATGTNNAIDFSTDTNPITADLSTGKFQTGSGSDTITGVTSVLGSQGGHNTFVAGTASETFGDTGIVGGDAINFSHVQTSTNTPLTVNVSGGPASGQGNDTATVGSGSATYTFSNGGANFTSFTGSSTGNTTFLAGPTPGYTFAGQGANNSIDFSAVTSGGVTVNLSAGPNPPSPVAPNVTLPGAGTDTITGLTTVVGSNGGGNHFTAGPAGATYTFTGNGDNNTFVGGGGPDIFNSNGSDNTFTAGTGNATFNDAGSSNTVDLSALVGSSVVDVAGQTVGGTANDTATSGGATYTFTTFGNQPTTFSGSQGGTTFYAGTVGDTFRGNSASDTLSFADTQSSAPLRITPVQACPAPGVVPTGQATLGPVSEPFCGIEVFDGLAGGNTTLVTDGTSALTFAATGTNNAADFSTDTKPITADLNAGTFQTGGVTDTITGVTSVLGSQGGHNTFVAGAASETFGDTGTVGGDAINFSHVQTSTNTPLTVNVSGGPASGQGNDTATVGSGSATYTFSNGGANFTSFTGSSTGNTTFLAGPTPGYTFAGQGANNSIDFSAVTSGGVTVNLSAGPNPPSPVAPNVTLPGAGTDTITGLTTVVGSNGGGNHFTAGSTNDTYTFTGNGNNNTFTGGAATDYFTSNGGHNTFTAGSGSATFNDPGANNTIDFSAAPTPLTVNVAGVQAGGTAPDTASGGGSIYTFTTFGTQPTILKGSSAGGTTFDAGLASDTFVGNGSTANPNTLSYAFAPSNGPLTISPAAPDCSSMGRAVLASATEPFCGIEVFDGLANGNTTFAPSGTGSFTFVGTGTNNSADFSANPNPVTVNLGANSGNVCTTSGCETLTGVTSVLGSQMGHNTFVAGNGSETFGDTGTVGGDSIDFSNVGTSTSTPLKVNVSGGPVNGQNNDTATVSSATYTFTQGVSSFTSFTGSLSGNTDFLAPATGGYVFKAAGANNVIDFTAATSGIGVDLSAGPSTTSAVSLLGGTDTIKGLTTVIGSNAGSNRFVAGSSSDTYTFTGNGNNNTFVGGAAPDIFNSNGNNNTFTAGTGSATFSDGGSFNTVDLSALSGTAVVNVAGPTAGGTASGTATSAGSTYTFTSFGTSPTTFNGSRGGTTFYAGLVGDTFRGSGTPADVLSFANTPSTGPLTFTSGSACVPGQVPSSVASLGSVTEPFCGIKVFEGLAGGNTTFVTDGTAGLTFRATGTNNAADFSTDPKSITADLNSGTFQTGTGTDTITGVTSVLGSQVGHNTFVAGTTSETFGDNGTVGGDAIDFSHVPTSAAVPLTVNASGASVPGVSSGTAIVGSATYTFSQGGTDFVTFTGAANGYTKFVAPGASGDYAFCARTPSIVSGHLVCGSGVSPPGDSVDFSAGFNGITANLSPTTVGGLDPNQVSVGGATAPHNVDIIGGMTTVVGASSGPNTFYGGLLGTTFNAASSTNTLSYAGVPLSGQGVTINSSSGHVNGPNGTTDTFTFTPTTVVGSPGNDTFTLGTAALNLQGGGGTDTIDLSQDTAGVIVNLESGQVSGSAIGNGNNNVTFSPGLTCSAQSTDLCVGSVIGTSHDDTFIAAPTLTALPTLKGNGGNDSLDLSNLTGPVTVAMPIGTTAGSVTGSGTTFTGISNVTGPGGGDTFVVGSGSESFTENGTKPGTLDYSVVGTNPNVGVTVNVGPGGVGSVTSLPALGVSDSFANINDFIGTAGPDNFKQSGAGNYTFDGRLGSNILDLSAAPSGVNVSVQPDLSGVCTPGMGANNGMTAGSGVNDSFFCMIQVIAAGTPVFMAQQGQQATLNGGGNGTLELTNATGGVTVDLGKGTVTGGGFNFSFTGMSVVDGTPYNDLFIPSSGNATVNIINGGGGGDDAVSYSAAPAAVVANLSSSPYTVPTGFTGAGTSVPPRTAIGGYGGTITLNGISNLIGTSRYNDVLVGGPGSGTLIGGSGNDRFVLSGGDTFVSGGTGTGTTLDMSLLAGQTRLNLGSSAPQSTGGGTVTVAPGSIHTVIASPGGSQLSAGNGNVTLIGGPGNDWLAAGTGNQTLIGGGGTDTLVGGVAPPGTTQSLQGGAQPVTFVPGQGNENLTSQGGGNTISFASAPAAVQVNLSTSSYSVPPGEPMANTYLAPQSASGGWSTPGTPLNLAQANITSVVGTPKADAIVTGSGNDNIDGRGSADLIVVNSGNNVLKASSGTNTTFLFEGSGSNQIQGGGAATVDFSQAPAGVTVNLQNGTANGGFGGFQSLTGVLNAVGTNFNDTLIAGAPGGTITGLNGGGDHLQSGPNGGDKLVSGGSASDFFCAEISCAIAGTTAGGGNTMTGGFGNDTFYARNGVVDTIDGGGGLNSAQIDANDIILNNSIQNLIP